MAEVEVIEVVVDSEIAVIEVVDLQGIQGPPGSGEGSGDATDVLNQLQAHIASSTPHPEFENIPSLVLIFENGLSRNG